MFQKLTQRRTLKWW